MEEVGGRFRWWIYTIFFALLYLTGETDSAARFLSHVPHDDYLPEGFERGIPDFDADVKIPGRHYPKRPYQNPYLENDQDDFIPQQHPSSHQSFYHNNHNLHHHSSSFHHSHHKGYHHTSHTDSPHEGYGNGFQQEQQPHHHQTEPIMAYGARRNPQGTTFNRELHFDNIHRDYDDDHDDDDDGDDDDPADYLDDTRSIAAVDTQSGHRLGGYFGSKTTPAPSTTPRPPTPSFGRDTPRSFTVQSGKTAKLICKVLNVGDKSVSWMRHEDLHILTVGKYKYSTDKRLSVIFNEADQEWILQIQSVQQEDEGLYECQVSTKPVLSFIVSMDVVESLPSTTPFPKMRDAEDPGLQSEDVFEVPSARIINGPEIFVHRGSLINLTCIVDHTVERPSYIYWYHYNKMIDYEKTGDIVKLDKSGPNTISNLLVKDASQKDSGKYSCRPSNGEDASVMLHVLNGENQAAMQTNTSDRIMTSVASVLGAISVGISAVIVMCRC